MAPSPPPLLARDGECARIVDALAADRPVLVTGEAGIGKTALVSAAVRATGRGLLRGAAFATLAGMPHLALRLALGAPVSGTPEHVAARIEAAVGEGVLFLDDCQWLDPETAAVVPLLVGRIALVVATRDPRAPAGLGLPADTLVVRLGPLDREAATSIVRGVRDDLDGPTLADLLARAGGNPLLLQELARDGRPSPTLARAVAARVAAATPAAREALGVLAIADRPLALPLAPAVRDELEAAGLATDDGVARAVRHALIAEAVLAGMTETERVAAHARVAALVPDDALAALHLARAGRAEEAVERALGALDRTPDRRERAALLRVAADAATGAAAARLRLDAARAALAVEEHAAAAELLAIGSHEGEGDGVREALLARAYGFLGRGPERDAALARAAALDLHPSGEAAHLVGIERAVALANGGELAAAIAVLDEVERRDVTGPPAWRAARVSMRETLRFMAGDRPDIAALRGTVEQALAAEDPAAMARAANLVSVELGTLGPGPALATAEDTVRRLEAADLDSSRLRAERIQLLVFLGRAAEAVVAADELLERPYPFHARPWALVQRAEALCHLGRLADAEHTLASASPMLTDDWMDRGEAATTQAHVAFWSGRPREALDAAGRAISIPTHYDGNYLLPSLIRAWAQLDLGRAPDLLPATAPSWVATAAAAEWAGICALGSGQPAVTAFERAAGLWDGRHALRSAVCGWAAAEAARREGARTAPDRLKDALANADGHGFEPLAARIRRSLRLAGVRVARRAPDPSGRGLLTPRERELLDLVAAGQSNAEIGRRMGLGRGTVVRIVSSAMAKLGAESRAQAVTLLAERA